MVWWGLLYSGLGFQSRLQPRLVSASYIFQPNPDPNWQLHWSWTPGFLPRRAQEDLVRVRESRVVTRNTLLARSQSQRITSLPSLSALPRNQTQYTPYFIIFVTSYKRYFECIGRRPWFAQWRPFQGSIASPPLPNSRFQEFLQLLLPCFPQSQP